MKRVNLRILLSQVMLGVIAASVFSPTSDGADWRQFRGDGGSGLSEESDLPTAWGPTENIKWVADIPGQGWACPIVSNGKVIVATAVSEGDNRRESNTRWELHCFDAESGKSLWTEVASTGKPRVGTHRDNTYASETPATDGKHILAYFGMTGVFCYDFSGKLLWKKDLGVFNMRNNWGTSSSPVLLDGIAYIQVDSEEDSFIVALDAATGEEKWRQPRDEGSNWGSVVIWKNSLRTELVTSGEKARSYDPKDGRLLWEVELGTSASSSPSSVGDMLLVGTSGRRSRGGFAAIKAGASGDLSADGAEGALWFTDEVVPSRASPLLYEGHVYVLSGRGGIVTCLNAETGEEVYQERMPDGGSFWGSPFAYGGKVFCPADNGSTYVLKAGPNFELIGTNKLDGKFWSTPALANGSLFIRSADKLYCVGNQ